jgi:DNA-binding NarL/FixJ family response regulator
MEPAGRFTERELQVAAMLADGHRCAAIAFELALSQDTVRTYMKSLRAKTHRTTSAGAIAALLRDRQIR